MPIYPEEWYNGFDPDLAIRTEDLYNVRAIPSLYLLDADKRVILKDAPEDKVFSVISSAIQEYSYNLGPCTTKETDRCCLPALLASSYYHDPYIACEYDRKPNVEPHMLMLELLWRDFDLKGKALFCLP